MIGQLTVIKNKGLDTVSGLGHSCVTDGEVMCKTEGSCCFCSCLLFSLAFNAARYR